MAFMRIHCDVCGGTWEIYHRDDWHDDKARQCPHCFSKIDRQVWEKEVLPAFGAVQDANTELHREHTGYHKPLFAIDFIADHLYQNRRESTAEACPLMEQLQEIEQLYEGLF